MSHSTGAYFVIRAASHAGETQQRIDCLAAWRDCPFYSEEERAALELTEAVTLITRNGVPDGCLGSKTR